MLRNEEEIAKTHSDVVKKHNNARSTYAFGSAVLTDQGREALFQWIERTAGFIQALHWVRNPETKLPDFINEVDRII